MFYLVDIDHEIMHYGVGYIGAKCERKCVNERDCMGGVHTSPPPSQVYILEGRVLHP